MVKHVVTFRFAGSTSERATAATLFRDALLALPAQIQELKAIEVGININPAEDYDLVLIAQADSLEDVAAYSANPAHKAAVSLVADRIISRACVDFIAD